MKEYITEESVSTLLHAIFHVVGSTVGQIFIWLVGLFTVLPFIILVGVAVWIPIFFIRLILGKLKIDDTSHYHD